MVSDLVEDFPAAHNFKRRRTAPPLLDGASRGWSQRDEDEEDCYISDDEDSVAPTPLDGSAGEYSSTNTLLRELHTLNQHRLLFSPSTEKSHPPSLSPPKYLSQHSFSPESSNHIPPWSKGQISSGGGVAHHIQANSFYDDGAQDVGDEMVHVMKRYEGTNK